MKQKCKFPSFQTAVSCDENHCGILIKWLPGLQGRLSVDSLNNTGKFRILEATISREYLQAEPVQIYFKIFSIMQFDLFLLLICL